jgi:hypothetical protein
LRSREQGIHRLQDSKRWQPSKVCFSWCECDKVHCCVLLGNAKFLWGVVRGTSSSSPFAGVSSFRSRHDGDARVLLIAAREHLHHISRVAACQPQSRRRVGVGRHCLAVVVGFSAGNFFRGWCTVRSHLVLFFGVKLVCVPPRILAFSPLTHPSSSAGFGFLSVAPSL